MRNSKFVLLYNSLSPNIQKAFIKWLKKDEDEILVRLCSVILKILDSKMEDEEVEVQTILRKVWWENDKKANTKADKVLFTKRISDLNKALERYLRIEYFESEPIKSKILMWEVYKKHQMESLISRKNAEEVLKMVEEKKNRGTDYHETQLKFYTFSQHTGNQSYKSQEEAQAQLEADRVNMYKHFQLKWANEYLFLLCNQMSVDNKEEQADGKPVEKKIPVEMGGESIVPYIKGVDFLATDEIIEIYLALYEFINDQKVEQKEIQGLFEKLKERQEKFEDSRFRDVWKLFLNKAMSWNRQYATVSNYKTTWHFFEFGIAQKLIYTNNRLLQNSYETIVRIFLRAFDGNEENIEDKILKINRLKEDIPQGESNDAKPDYVSDVLLLLLLWKQKKHKNIHSLMRNNHYGKRYRTEMKLLEIKNTYCLEYKDRNSIFDENAYNQLKSKLEYQMSFFNQIDLTKMKEPGKRDYFLKEELQIWLLLIEFMYRHETSVKQKLRIVWQKLENEQISVPDRSWYMSVIQAELKKDVPFIKEKRTSF